MKKKVLFLLVFAMLMSIVMVGTAFAKEVYTVSVAVEYNDEDKLAHYDINQVSGNVVYDKMASLGAKYYLTEFDPEGVREIITAIFEVNFSDFKTQFFVIKDTITAIKNIVMFKKSTLKPSIPL